MTFKNLEKSQEASYKNVNAITDTPDATASTDGSQTPFNNEQLHGQWISMCIRMEHITEMYGMSQRLKMLTPTITEFPNIEVVIDNPILMEDVSKIKNRIRTTLVRGLNNYALTINYRLAEQSEIKVIKSKK